ncbi:LysR family transcriptional regulator [Actinomadura sp. 6N118]|uniref:LysR family transcriptional regulator n=1 Tax=Actinomadura sp. 6N118 TaxID=3375151 RepID=UPI0037B5ACA8
MALSLEDLRVFLSVAGAGSFGRGAARLHLSQPTVSERMARLERDLGRRLFLRTQRGVRLTPAGERLLPYAERCLALADEAVSAVRGEHNRPRLQVAMHSTFAPTVMPQVVDALAAQEVEVSSTDAHSDDVLRLLHDGLVDIGFVVPGPYPSTITVEPFLTDPMTCVAHPDHHLADRSSLHVADLAACAVACTVWGDGAERFLQLLRTTSIPSSRLHAVSPAETVASLARRGSHIGVLTRSTVMNDLATGTLIELPVADLPRWEITLALAYRTTDANTAHVQALRTALLMQHAAGSASSRPHRGQTAHDKRRTG